MPICCILVAEIEHFQGHVVFNETDLDDFKRKSQALTDNEEENNGRKDKGAFLPLPLKQRLLASYYIDDTYY